MSYRNRGYSNFNYDKMKKFYNRENELALLKATGKKAEKSAQMTFVVGRRRIGKTSLLLKAFENSTYLYFFVAKKSEALLCQEFIETVSTQLKVPVFGEIKTFRELFSLLMHIAKDHHFTLVIDEFQEFMSVNRSVYSDMQQVWDLNKSESKLNLVLCGSVYSMMTSIFENSKEPLFGRATQRIHLKPFTIATVKEILKDNFPNYTAEDLLSFYLFTGGVARYIELFTDAQAFTKETMLNEIIRDNSLFLDEGRNVLIDEFGKDYGIYFSILSLIASGKTSRVEIESILEIQTGGYLDRLENDYSLIQKIRPIFSKPNSRSVKYKIIDNFLSFWFRFIYKHNSLVEIENYDYLKEIVNRDYSAYSGIILERYFTQKLIVTKKYSQLGTYWERGNRNEIDIVAVDELKKEITLFEVKKNKENISISKLREKGVNLENSFPNYMFKYVGLSLKDM